MKNKAVRLSDIAKKLDVSVVTVSKALRDHPDISAKKTKEIKKVAEQMGYTPNLMARGLSARRSNYIGVIIPKIAHFFFGSIIEHLYDFALEQNYEILLTVSQEKAEIEKRHIQTLLSMNVDGIIISISQETKDYAIFSKIKERGIPLVFMDRIPNLENINTVAVNDYEGSFKAIEHAIKIGYKNIAHFAGYPDINIGNKRLQGYLDAMKKHGLPIKKEWIIEGGFGEAYGYKALMDLYKAKNLPDLIYTVTYPVALGVYSAARELGLSIPNDIDVICFGNAKMQNIITPALSCIDQPTDKLAQKSLELISENIKNGEEHVARQELIETELILRETCIKIN